MKKNLTTRVLKVGVMTGISLMSAAVFAEGPANIGALVSSGGDMAGSTLGGLEQLAGLVGFIMFGTSGYKLLTNKGQQQEGVGKLWGALFAGVFLISVVSYQAIMKNSVLQTTDGADDIRTLIKGS